MLFRWDISISYLLYRPGISAEAWGPVLNDIASNEFIALAISAFLGLLFIYKRSYEKAKELLRVGNEREKRHFYLPAIVLIIGVVVLQILYIIGILFLRGELGDRTFLLAVLMASKIVFLVSTIWMFHRGMKKDIDGWRRFFIVNNGQIPAREITVNECHANYSNMKFTIFDTADKCCPAVVKKYDSKERPLAFDELHLCMDRCIEDKACADTCMDDSSSCVYHSTFEKHLFKRASDFTKRLVDNFDCGTLDSITTLDAFESNCRTQLVQKGRTSNISFVALKNYLVGYSAVIECIIDDDDVANEYDNRKPDVFAGLHYMGLKRAMRNSSAPLMFLDDMTKKQFQNRIRNYNDHPLYDGSRIIIERNRLNNFHQLICAFLCVRCDTSFINREEEYREMDILCRGIIDSVRSACKEKQENSPTVST